MKLRFAKMHGAGNDFVVFDGVTQSIELSAERVRRIADRHFGIGCDQVLLVERPTVPQADFRYRIFNADGGEVEQCGNGARCFVRFVRDHGLTTQSEIRVETLSGIICPRMEPSGEVTVDMGAPSFAPARIPFIADSPDLVQSLEVDGQRLEITALSMGNPHAVQFVPDIDAAPVTQQGPLIERHARFPQRVNAGYAQVLDRGRIKLRVWERGAGETLACGTGACAAAVAGICRGLLDSPVRVLTRGGELSIAWEGAGPQGSEAVNSGKIASVRMSGPAITVFEGEIEFNE